jgi:hypothetical protein
MSAAAPVNRLFGESALLGPIGVGLAILAAIIFLFFAYRFERFVAVRYLQRTAPSRAIRVGLSMTVAGVAAGLVVLAASHGHSRGLETAGVVLTLVAALAMLLFVLLRVFSVFTTVSTMGVVLGVASLVVVLAVTSGFEHEFQDKVLAVNAHLIVTSYGLERDMAEAEPGRPAGAETHVHLQLHSRGSHDWQGGRQSQGRRPVRRRARAATDHGGRLCR